MDDRVRQVLEREHGLRLERRLGRGGFAEVYAAESEGGVACAIKVSLDPLDGQSPAVRKELENLQHLKALGSHPNIVTLMDVWLIEGYLVTRWELAQGTLQDVLRRYREQGQEGLPVKNLLGYISEAAEAIDFLNAQGVYHRDIKPANLLVFHDHVKLGDVGLAKLAGVSTVSHSGSGTLGYLPPEAYDQHRLSPTVDVYSLAATYVELRTGRVPFGDNPTEILHRQDAGKPILDGLGREEADLVCRALAAKPEERFQGGAKEWVRSLSAAVRGGHQPQSISLLPTPPVIPASLCEPSGSTTATAKFVPPFAWSASPPSLASGQSDEAPSGPIDRATEKATQGQAATKSWWYDTVDSVITVAIFGVTAGVIVGAIEGGIGGAIAGAILGAINGAILGAILGGISWAIDKIKKKAAADIGSRQRDEAPSGPIDRAPDKATQGQAVTKSWWDNIVSGAYLWAIAGAIDGAIFGALARGIDGAIVGAMALAIFAAIVGGIFGGISWAIDKIKKKAAADRRQAK